MEIPILYASVPPMPTVKILAGVMLAALNAPDCERGTGKRKVEATAGLDAGNRNTHGDDR
jgi:hypothetical protein